MHIFTHLFSFTPEFGYTFVRFILCIFVNWIIVEFLYFRKSRRRDFFFTFMLISVAIYFLVYLMMGMERGKATMGVGLGLFGIFSIMRYRTDTMPVREMTYLFIVICLSVIHSMAEPGVDGTPLTELILIDLTTIIAIILCEKKLDVHPVKIIQYDRIDLIKPEKREELFADLKERTGLKIEKIEIGGIDFLKDTAVLRITYDDKVLNDINEQFKVKKSQW